ncbi:MAG: hypothetical protein E7612_04960 [Ruminococcaceae bacterium]|nr:hypothetical protein [Oscillospiraceae bacterium]
MFKIAAIQDKEVQKKYAEECGAEFCPDLFAYSMINQETGELMGIAQFDISGESGYIKTLKTKIGYSDFEAMFILGRATMNFIDLCGNHSCYAAKNAGEERLLRAIGFKQNESGEYFADMTHMFDGHCDGKAVDLEKK